MKILSLSLMVICCAVGIFGQQETPKIKLTGTVENIEIIKIEKKSVTIGHRLNIKVKLRITNESSKAIIFLQKLPQIINFKLKGNNPEYMGDAILAESGGNRSSDGYTEKDWKKIKTELDQPTPPSSKTFLLSAGNFLEFEDVISFWLPQKPNEKSYTFYRKFSLQQVKESSDIYIELVVEPWLTLPTIINGKVNQTVRPKFENRLRRKWRNFGYVFTNQIISEPILVDMENIFQRTNS